MATKVKAELAVKNFSTSLRTGDPVIVIAGGNSKKGKELAGKTGKILKFLPKTNRVIVEGLNNIKKHKKASNVNETSGVIEKEGSVHISNVMYYVESLKKPVRIKKKSLDDGRKVRGYLNPETKQFEQIDV